jgi:hypothetical protein
MTGRSDAFEQALVDAESWRAQAELTCAEAQVAYDAARKTLGTARQALTIATRTTGLLRELVSEELLTG